MKKTCYNIYLFIHRECDLFLPVPLSDNPEGLEDNYAFTDGQCDWEVGDCGVDERARGEAQKEKSNPSGHQDINDCGHSEPDIANIIYSILPGRGRTYQTKVSSSVDEPVSLNS